MADYRVRARNTAPDSENRMHDDLVAAAYGFRGGLVPGTTVYGYLTVPVIARCGAEWLERGGMHLRLMQPVYDGDEIEVTLAGDLVSAQRSDGTLCAAGAIRWPQGDAPPLDRYPEQPLPAERPDASAESLAPGRMLGALDADLALPDAHHPAALLSLSNQVLMENVRLGPWIHAGSEIRHFSLARNGERLSVRARVEDRFERKGHQFVVLDVGVIGGGTRFVQQVRHTAIYQPRRG